MNRFKFNQLQIKNDLKIGDARWHHFCGILFVLINELHFAALQRNSLYMKIFFSCNTCCDVCGTSLYLNVHDQSLKISSLLNKTRNKSFLFLRILPKSAGKIF